MHRNLRLYRHSSCSTDCSSFLNANLSQEQIKLPNIKQQEKPSLIGALQYGQLQLRVLRRSVEETQNKKQQYYFHERREKNYKKILPKVQVPKNNSVALQTTGFSPWIQE
ncbi:unnamed protein product (macronuclear) [Paramecium tetraurelia]|uniref:Uncharacterized protein n=1 Tax=Paramecium tetraurelia TaxID=5888 RepID=A0BCC2_PARTE|nr:uncharacterized protein GSPATT00004283001 [Paramecium tetraurelia]CAK56189.1 unnamed protein product [Paramecium tetraurelia]|eukprot:XP_001423587.1 hypothetical protein (macronuclear) [Paramecium tetraurelia strain d4-2]